jgi:hypothetical protein
MSEKTHKIFIGVLVTTVIIVLVFLTYRGISYYKTSTEDRFYHPDNILLKPSGILGHGYGIIGSLMIVIGVSSYMARKRYRFLLRLGVLKHWLEFHIFLCTLGPILVLFHTAYKFGGLVAISFWSMVAVFLSGIAGRFIYLQIPRTIEGQELSLNDLRAMRNDTAELLKSSYNLDEQSYDLITNSIKTKDEIFSKSEVIKLFKKSVEDRKTVHFIKVLLRQKNMQKSEITQITQLVKGDIRLNRKIERLEIMQNLFKYWHVVHSPFALVMLVIMIIHIGVTIAFGYKWIF